MNYSKNYLSSPLFQNTIYMECVIGIIYGFVVNLSKLGSFLMSSFNIELELYWNKAFCGYKCQVEDGMSVCLDYSYYA